MAVRRVGFGVWIPAFAGMTGMGAGKTMMGAGKTMMGAGMVMGAGMTGMAMGAGMVTETGMTVRRRAILNS